MRFKEFFYVRRSDRMVVIIFLVLGILALVVSLWIGRESDETAIAEASDSTLMRRSEDRAAVLRERRNAPMAYATDGGRQVERFYFDPNTADSTDLLRLGLSPWSVRSIYRYRAKGGVYRRPNDFARVYGLTQKQYRELAPYIRISDDYQPAEALYTPAERLPRDTSRHPTPKLRTGEQIEVNASDTTMLKRVPGIGSYFAGQIVRYRERLGGFYDKRQLLEINDFPAEALPYLTVSAPVRKLRINQLSLNELKRHPYINFYQARDIIEYRRQRGPLKNIRELRLLPDFTDTDLERLSHYLSYE